jgi:hypothetical protein
MYACIVEGINYLAFIFYLFIYLSDTTTSTAGNAKIAKDAKESIQECVSEFISFITSEV